MAKKIKKAHFRIHYEFIGTTEQGHQIGIRLKALNWQAWKIILNYKIERYINMYVEAMLLIMFASYELQQVDSKIENLKVTLQQQQKELEPEQA